MNTEALTTERANIDTQIAKLEVALAKGEPTGDLLDQLHKKRDRLDSALRGHSALADAEAAKRAAQARADDEKRHAELVASHGEAALERDRQAFAAKVAPLVAQLADLTRQIVERAKDGYRAAHEVQALSRAMGVETPMPFWTPEIIIGSVRGKIAEQAVADETDWKTLQLLADMVKVR